MDPFTSLPTPLLLDILKNISDFTTLQLFLSASRAANALFRDYAFEVTNAIADSSLDLELPQYLYTLFAIHTGNVLSQTLEEFLRDYIHGNRAFLRLREDCRRCQSDVDLATLGHLRRVLDCAANIERLTILCLDKLLSRFATIKPLILIDPQSLYGKDFEPRGNGPNILHFTTPNLSWPFAGSQSPPSSPLKVDREARNLAPSWIELFRVKRALWTIQVFLETKARLALSGWPTGSDENDACVDFRQIFNDVYNPPAESHVKEVAQCLIDLGPDLDALWFYSRQTPPSTLIHDQSLPSQFPSIILSRLPECRRSSTPSSFWPREPTDEDSVLWEQTAKTLSGGTYSTGCSMLWRLLEFLRDREEIVNEKKIVQVTMIAEWLGLRVWDLRRLSCLGLATVFTRTSSLEGVSLHERRPVEHLLFTWWSVILPWAIPGS